MAVYDGRVALRVLEAAAIQKQAADDRAADLARQEEERLERRRQLVASLGPWGEDLVTAAETYGQDPWELHRVMLCESKGDARAQNDEPVAGEHATGLFQFLPSTWAGTPYAGQSIYDGHAQVMAAAWMWSQGRQEEWACY